jgi:hypothetical protein
MSQRGRTGIMRYSEAVVTKPVVDLHATTNIRSERVTQVILGTQLVVAREQRGWLWVTAPDTYRGWIEPAATRRLKFRQSRYASRGRIALVTSNVAVVYLEPFGEPRERITVTVDVRLELVSEQRHRFRVHLPDGRFGWIRRQEVSVREASFRYPVRGRQKTAETGMRFLGVPYLWGGTTPLGFDCSGLVQLIYKMNGIDIPLDADMQFMVGTPVGTREMEPADLLFFSTKSSGITHGGIYLGDGDFLHASGKANGVTVTRFKDPFFQSTFVEARSLWHPRRL